MHSRHLSSILGISILLASLATGICWADPPAARISGGFDALLLDMNQKLQQADLGAAALGRFLTQNQTVGYRLLAASARAKVNFNGTSLEDFSIERATGKLRLTAFYDYRTGSGDGRSGKVKWKEMIKTKDDGMSFNYGYKDVPPPRGWESHTQFIPWDYLNRNGKSYTMGVAFNSNKKGRDGEITLGGIYLIAADPVLLNHGEYLEALIVTQMRLELDRAVALEVARRRAQEPPRP